MLVCRSVEMTCHHFLPPDNSRESRFRLGLPSVGSLSPLVELVLLELVSDECRPRDKSAAPMISSNRTSSCGDVVLKPDSRISVNLEGIVAKGGCTILYWTVLYTSWLVLLVQAECSTTKCFERMSTRLKNSDRTRRVMIEKKMVNIEGGSAHFVHFCPFRPRHTISSVRSAKFAVASLAPLFEGLETQ